MDKDTPSPTYEQAAAELEKLIDRLEKGNMPLEESLAAFTEGMRLAAYCRQKLDEVEKKMTILLERQDGTLDEQVFSTPESG